MTKDLSKYKDFEVNWSAIMLADPDILGGILRDVVVKGGRSKNSNSSTQINGISSLSEEKFSVALKALKGTCSNLEFSEKLDMPEFIVELLLQGEVTPDIELLCSIAESLDKPYNFFLEYRIEKVLTGIEKFLFAHPETVDAWFKKAGLS